MSNKWQQSTAQPEFLENRIETEGGDSFVLYTND